MTADRRPTRDIVAERSTGERYADLFDGGPLDHTRLGKAIADTVPEANREARMEDFRADLKRRVAQRRQAARRIGGAR